MGKKGAKETWYEYYISMHLGFCHGPLDAITRITFQDKEAWKGHANVNTLLDINKPKLFGGRKREGGIAGKVSVMLGDRDQLAPVELTSRLGRTPETCPAFRDICSLVFTGRSGEKGFMVSANMPNVPPIAMTGRRAPRGAPFPHHTIIGPDGHHDANPAHMIWECLTNDVWGMDGTEAMIDIESFAKAAKTLKDEGFGLSMLWAQQGTIEKFISEILDHINALFFFNPRTGLGEIRLLRNDYDRDKCRKVTPHNCKLKKFRRKLWGETVNEIVVSWTAPETEEPVTVTFQDLANIAMQGQVVSEKRDYYGVRNGELAERVGARDIAAAASPLATASLELDRRFWDLLPGDVIEFSWPAHGVEKIYMRVNAIDYGRPGDSVIKVDVVEDIHAVEHASYRAVNKGEWVAPDVDPNDPDLDLEVQAIFTAPPYSMIVQATGEDVPDDRFPETPIMVFGTPTNEPGQQDIQSFTIATKQVLPTGDSEWRAVADVVTTGKTILLGKLKQAVSSEIKMDLELLRGRTRPQVGGLGFIGPFGDSARGSGRFEYVSEVVLFLEELDSDGTWRIARGMLDTVPQTWPAGSHIWFVDENFDAIDPALQLADTQLEYKLPPTTSLGTRDLDLTPIVTTNRPGRPYLPYRPANVRVDGQLFGDVEVSGHDPRPENIKVTWSHRNRHTEDSIYRRWDEATTAPERGQSAVVTIDGQDHDCDTSTQFNIDPYSTGHAEELEISVCAERDGERSLQGMKRKRKLYPKGFGNDFGMFFGGWPDN